MDDPTRAYPDTFTLRGGEMDILFVLTRTGPISYVNGTLLACYRRMRGEITWKLSKYGIEVGGLYNRLEECGGSSSYAPNNEGTFNHFSPTWTPSQKETNVI